MPEILLYTLVNAGIVLLACTGLLLIPLRKWQQGIIFLYLFLVLFLLQDVLGQMVTPFTVMGTVILICIFEHHITWNITSSLIGYISSVTLNHLAIIFCIKILRIPQEKLYQEYSFWFSCCFLLFLWIGTRLIQRQIDKKRHLLLEKQLPRKISGIICIFLSICAFIYIFTIIYNEFTNYAIPYLVITCVLFFLFLVFLLLILGILFHMWSQKIEMERKMENFQVLQEHSNRMEQEYMNLRSFKHDYTNILASLYSYIEEDDIEGLQEYFYTKIFPLKNQISLEDAKLALLSKLEVTELKGLFLTKLTYALHCKLILNIEIKDTFSLPHKNGIVELTRILGILLDNAIEAALESQKKELLVAFFSDDKKNVIIIQNSVLHPVTNLGKIFSLDYSTKGRNRGIGLYQAKKLLDEQEHLLLTTDQKNDYFYQKLEIFS